MSNFRAASLIMLCTDHHFTCAIYSTSSESYIACADKSPICVATSCILITGTRVDTLVDIWWQEITLHLINIYPLHFV